MGVIRIKVLVADDHGLLRDGVSAAIAAQPDMEVIGEATTGIEAVAQHRSLHPDVTLMDLRMPDMDGVEAIAAIRAQTPQARIIVLTTYSGDVLATRALKAGAAAYLLKSALRRDLISTIRAVNEGRKHIAPDVATAIAFSTADEPLSMREVEVLQLAAEGNSNKRIAAKLQISEDTVKGHMRSILAKLQVEDRTHAVTTAARRGIIEL